jgi:hypothetical protein
MSARSTTLVDGSPFVAVEPSPQLLGTPAARQMLAQMPLAVKSG